MAHARGLAALAFGLFTLGCNGPCGPTAVMSCDDGSSCHEFYSAEAASAVRDTCIRLGHVVSDGPCPAVYSVCCIDDSGSFGNPEGICFPRSHPQVGQLRANCNASDEMLCEE